jgi:uncharacterized membrane protein YgdD (TMEM256/DUF423 family)
MNWTATGALLMLLGVACGAFGAHALKARLDPSMMDVYHTAVQYHLIHALGILIVAVLLRTSAVSPAGGSRVAWFLLSGIILFSGSLYAMALSGVRVLGAITPLGGIAFIAGWLLLIFEAMAARS